MVFLTDFYYKTRKCCWRCDGYVENESKKVERTVFTQSSSSSSNSGWFVGGFWYWYMYSLMITVKIVAYIQK